MIRLDRFDALADRLEAQPERFWFGWWTGEGFDAHHCGTTACSLGHAVEMFGQECGAHFDYNGHPTTGLDDGDKFYPSARAIFGELSDAELDRLFVPISQSEHGVLPTSCTAAEAAAEIRKFVAEQRANARYPEAP